MATMRKIGATIALEGESAFKKSVSACTTSLKTMKSELSLVSKQYADNANSLEALQAQHDALNKVLEQSQRVEQETASALLNSQQNYAKAGDQLDEYRKQLTEAEKALNDMLDAQSKTGNVDDSAVKAQQDEVQRLTDMIARGEKEYEKAGNNIEAWQQKLNAARGEVIDLKRQIAENEKYMEEARNSTDGCATSIDQYGKKVKEAGDSASKSMKDAADAAKEASDKMSTFFTAEKIEQYADSISEAFQEVVSSAYEAHKSVQEGYDSIVKNTGATGAELEDFKDIANDIYGELPMEMEQIGDTIGLVNQRFNVQGKELENLSTKFLKFSDITGADLPENIGLAQRVMSAFNDDASKAGDYLDVLAYTAQQTGADISELQENTLEQAGALREMGADSMAAINFMGQLQTSGIYTEAAMGALEDAYDTCKETGRDFASALLEVQDELLTNENEAEANQKAYDLFGESFAKVAAAIRSGNIDFTELANSMGVVDKATGSIDKTFDDTTHTYDRMTVAINKLKQVGGEIVDEVLDTAAPAVELLADTAGAVNDAFQAMPEPLQKGISSIALVGTTVGVVAPKVISLLETVKAFKEAGTVKKQVEDLKKAFDKLKGAEDAADSVSKVAESVETVTDASKKATSGSSSIKKVTDSVDDLAKTAKKADDISDVADSIEDVTDMSKNATIGTGAIKNVTDAVDDLSDAAKNADNISDVADSIENVTEVAKNASNVAQVTEAVDDLADASRTADNLDDVADGMSNVASGATAGASAVGGLSGVLSKAGPYAAAAAGAIALLSVTADAIGDAVEENADKIIDSSDGLRDAMDAAKASTEEVQNFIDKVDEANSDYELQIGVLKVNRDNSEPLIEELDALESATHRTSDESSRLDSIIEQLNETYPELELSIDKVTGQFYANGKAINDASDYVLGYIDNVELAAKKSYLLELKKELAEGEVLMEQQYNKSQALLGEYNDLRSERNDIPIIGSVINAFGQNQAEDEARAAFDEANKVFLESCDAQDELRERIEITTSQIKEEEEAINEASSATADSTNIVTGYGDAADAAANQYAELIRRMKESDGDIEAVENSFDDSETALKELFESTVVTWQNAHDQITSGLSGEVESLSQNMGAWEEYRDSVRDSLQDTSTLFAGHAEQDSVTWETMMNNMQGNADMYAQWNENVSAVLNSARYQTDEAFREMANTIMTGGIESADYLQQFVDNVDMSTSSASDDIQEFARMSGVYDTYAGNLANLNQVTGDNLGGIAQAFDETKTVAQTALDELATSMQEQADIYNNYVANSTNLIESERYKTDEKFREFVNQLLNQGVSGAEQINALWEGVQSGSAEVEEAVNSYFSLKDATGLVANQMASVETALQDGFDKTVLITDDAGDAWQISMANNSDLMAAGVDMSGLISKIETGANQVPDVVEQALTSDSAKNTARSAGREIGQEIGLGIAEGVSMETSRGSSHSHRTARGSDDTNWVVDIVRKLFDDEL